MKNRIHAFESYCRRWAFHRLPSKCSHLKCRQVLLCFLGIANEHEGLLEPGKQAVTNQASCAGNERFHGVFSTGVFHALRNTTKRAAHTIAHTPASISSHGRLYSLASTESV